MLRAFLAALALSLLGLVSMTGCTNEFPGTWPLLYLPQDSGTISAELVDEVTGERKPIVLHLSGGSYIRAQITPKEDTPRPSAKGKVLAWGR